MPVARPESPRAIWIGIDPGVKGGAVALLGSTPYVFTMNGGNVYDVRNWLDAIRAQSRDLQIPIRVILEEVSGFIGQTIEGQKRNVAAAHTTFVLGESFGIWQACLCCARLSFRMVRPQEWQKQLAIKPKLKGEKPNQFKGRLKSEAKKRFPDYKITLETSDAFLLAYLCRSLYP
jgi:hypothetical protein